MTWALYLLLAILPMVVHAIPALGDRVAGTPAVRDFIPYLAPAVLVLVGYLGWKLRQSRVLVSGLLLLPACVAFRRDDVLLPPVFGVLALALPLSLAIVFVFPDGPLLAPGWPWRVMAVLAPFAVLGGMAQWRPDDFVRLAAVGIPIPPAACRVPQLAVAFALPLAAAGWLRWNARIRWFIFAMLPALVPLWFATHATLSAWWKPATCVWVGLACAATALILLHAILHVFWRRVYLDELTDLQNRRSLEEDLARLGGPFIVAMLDVDRFKEFNDRYGHPAGDQVLRMIATRLRGDLGTRTYRYGGEEFCVLLDGADGEAAARRLDAFRHRIEAHPFRLRTHVPRVRADRGSTSANAPAAPDPGLQVTVSLGVAVRRRPDEAPAHVLHRADEALYRAKNQGRNRLVLAD